MAGRRQYGGDWNERYLHYWGIALTATLMTSLLMTVKFFDFFGLKLGAGMIFFPLCLIIGDVISEVYGFKKARQVIIAALLARLFMLFSCQVVIMLPPAPEWHLQGEFEAILGDSYRMALASCLGYLSGELSNSFIMSRMKIRMDGRHFWLRAVVSTLVGEFLSTFFYQITAFYGKMPLEFLMQVIVNGSLLKTGVEVLVLPLTAYICVRLKRAEGVDYFDGKPL